MNKVTDIHIDNFIETLLTTKYLGKKFPLEESEIFGLLQATKSCLMLEPILLELKPPMNVCGDFHGQFEDLKQILSTIGLPEKGQNYLFLGDYVDRGKQSLECICLLFAYKVKFRNNFFLLRGNHECAEVNRVYGFFDECKRRLTLKVWKAFSDCFNCLPLAAVIGSRIFCVHGGLSPMMGHLSDINQIKRPVELVRGTLLCDLLWSDPSMEERGWVDNMERGVSYVFGKDVINQFLKTYDLDLICRSHQVVEDGYQFGDNRQILTIFSAPNYCNKFDNFGAVLIIELDMVCHIKQFKGVVEAQKDRRFSTPAKVIQSSNVLAERLNMLKAPFQDRKNEEKSKSRSRSYRNSLDITPMKSKINAQKIRSRKKTDYKQKR